MVDSCRFCIMLLTKQRRRQFVLLKRSFYSRLVHGECLGGGEWERSATARPATATVRPATATATARTATAATTATAAAVPAGP
jgi:hypothetical protein